MLGLSACGARQGGASKWAKEERRRRWKENQELWRPGARSRVARRERSPGAGVRPGERMGTTALGLAARGRSPRSSGDGSTAARFWYMRETFHKMGVRRVSGGPRALAAHVLLWRLGTPLLPRHPASGPRPPELLVLLPPPGPLLRGPLAGSSLPGYGTWGRIEAW